MLKNAQWIFWRNYLLAWS